MPRTDNPMVLRNWFLADDVRVNRNARFATSAARIAAATPQEILAIAIRRYRGLMKEPDAKLRITVMRVGNKTTRYLVIAKNGRSVRACTMAKAIEKAAFDKFEPPPSYLQRTNYLQQRLRR